MGRNDWEDMKTHLVDATKYGTLSKDCEFHSLNLSVGGEMQSSAIRETTLETDLKTRSHCTSWPGTMEHALEVKLPCSYLNWPRSVHANCFLNFYF